MPLDTDLDLRGLLFCARTIDAARALLFDLELTRRASGTTGHLLRALISDLSDIYGSEGTTTEWDAVTARREDERHDEAESMTLLVMAPPPKCKSSPRKKPG